MVKRLSPAFELPRVLTLGLIAISTEYFGPTHRGHFRMALTASGCIVRTLNGRSLNCRGATDRRILRQLPRLRRVHRPVRIRSAFGVSLRRRLRRPACALRSRPHEHFSLARWSKPRLKRLILILPQSGLPSRFGDCISPMASHVAAAEVSALDVATRPSFLLIR